MSNLPISDFKYDWIRKPLPIDRLDPESASVSRTTHWPDQFWIAYAGHFPIDNSTLSGKIENYVVVTKIAVDQNGSMVRIAADAHDPLNRALIQAFLNQRVFFRGMDVEAW